MRYAIIGGVGFIGSHITDKLIEQGHDVVVIDNLYSGHKDYLNPKAKFEWGDIRNSNDLDKIFNKYAFERCINLAAQPYIPNCFIDPKLFFETNANGTLNVIMTCEKYGVDKLLQYASAEEYGTVKGQITEQTPISPQSTYGVSKVASDYLCRVRNKESGIKVISLRQFNCYGPRETHPYIIPELITQLSKSHKLRLGNIYAQRDFLYVEDAAEYAIELLEKGIEGEMYNLGSEGCLSIEDLAFMIADLMGQKKPKIDIDPKKLRPWDIEKLWNCNDKIHSVVDYRAQTTFEQGLLKTIKYYEEYGWKFREIGEEDSKTTYKSVRYSCK